MCDELSSPCCEAINRAIGNAIVQGAAILEAGRSLIDEELFPPDEIKARVQLVTAAAFRAGQVLRAAFARLIDLSRQCDSECCASAAAALAQVYLGTLQNIITASASIGIPTPSNSVPISSNSVPVPPNGVIDLAAVLSALVGAPLTPLTKPIQTPGTLHAYIELILDTVVCPSEPIPPCPPIPTCKPGRKVCKPVKPVKPCNRSNSD